jgi:hypothetical protein
MDEACSQAIPQLSYPVSSFPFCKGNIGIALGKDGLPMALARHCDSLVHIAHLPCTQRPSFGLLDVQSCLSILLHHFTNLANYDESTFQGNKFAVERPKREMREMQRRANRAEETRQEDDGQLTGTLFDDDDQAGDY